MTEETCHFIYFLRDDKRPEDAYLTFHGRVISTAQLKMANLYSKGVQTLHRQMSKNWQSRSMATSQAYLNPHDLGEKTSNITAGEIDASSAD